MTDLKKFAHDMMSFAKGAANNFAKAGQDFVPTFVILKDKGIQPMPMKHYTQDREFHLGLMKMMIDTLEADAFAFVMEAWVSYQPLPKDNRKGPINPENYQRPSQDPNRKEMLVVQCGSRDGQEVVLSVEIKRHGHKLTFDPILDMTDASQGRSVMGLTSNMFGTETIN